MFADLFIISFAKINKFTRDAYIAHELENQS